MKKLIASLAVATALVVGVAGNADAQTPARGVTSSQARNVAAIRAAWPNSLEGWAIRIARRESNLRANAISRTGDYGLMQINWRAHRAWLARYGITNPRQLLNPEVNARMAYRLYRMAGSRPWRATR